MCQRRPYSIYIKSFIRSYLDYGDALYDKPENEGFQNKLEKVQYRACLAITGAIRGTSKQKILQRTTIIFIIFWDFLMFCQNCFHRKWNEARLLIVNIKHELPHELPNYLRFRILGN